MPMVLMAGLLSGCFSIPGFEDENPIAQGTVGYVQGFYGGVAADEPHAVLVGRDVLAAGGSAADAAVAMYFMLSVTYPSAAGLGGGGVCLVRGANSAEVETLDFLGQPSSGPKGVRVNAPANPRGFFALHARYGVLEWRELIRPAENAARFGVRVSRAFGRELAAAGPAFAATTAGRLFVSPETKRIFGEGDTISQAELTAVLATIRSRGAAALYTGAYARQFAASAAESGVSLTYADLQALKPVWRSAIEILFNVKTSFYLPLPRTPVGTMAAKALAMSVADGRFEKADDGLRAHLVAEATQRALADGARGFKTVTPEGKTARVRLPEDYIEDLAESFHDDRVVRLAVNSPLPAPGAAVAGQTSFLAVDRIGGAVVCSTTMNARFGARRSVRGTGLVLAAEPVSSAARDLSSGLLLLTRRDKNMTYMAGAASGGVVAQAALIQAALRTAGGTPDDMDTAIRWKRLYRDPGQAVTFIERGTAEKIVNALRRRGHQLKTAPAMGRVNLLFCQFGVPSEAPQCGVRSDPRGFGLASASAS